MSKCFPDKDKEVYTSLLRSGFHYFLYVTNWSTPEQQQQQQQLCVSERFASLHNSLIFKGIYQLGEDGQILPNFGFQKLGPLQYIV